MVAARLGPSMAPSGLTSVASVMAVLTWSRPMPRPASASGRTRTRIAGCSAPLMLTSATPGTWDRRWATTVSAAS